MTKSIQMTMDLHVLVLRLCNGTALFGPDTTSSSVVIAGGLL